MRCRCRVRIEKGESEQEVFKSCVCSKGCCYCAENNLLRTDWNYKVRK